MYVYNLVMVVGFGFHLPKTAMTKLWNFFAKMGLQFFKEWETVWCQGVTKYEPNMGRHLRYVYMYVQKYEHPFVLK